MVVLDHQVVLSGPHVDVRRHVDQVPGSRHQLRQPVGAGQRPLGRGRGLHRVDIEVAGARMVRVLGDRLLQRGHHGLGVRTRLGATVGPVVPGRQVHQRLGVQRLHVGIVGVLLRQRREGVGVGGIERGAVGDRLGSVALGHRVDQVTLDRRGARLERHGPLDRGVGRAVHRRVHGRVDVRPHRVGDPPPAHGAGGVGLGPLGVGADRLVVIEGIGQPQAPGRSTAGLRRIWS